jgi:hypothetical protein
MSSVDEVAQIVRNDPEIFGRIRSLPKQVNVSQ